MYRSVLALCIQILIDDDLVDQIAADSCSNPAQDLAYLSPATILGTIWL